MVLIHTHTHTDTVPLSDVSIAMIREHLSVISSWHRSFCVFLYQICCILKKTFLFVNV